ncbi:hypothetical protein FOPG_16390 [Fusarium oxysporum f. sp. conglutinans race 2 54008]|uniref:Uncharacterized protein n=1 Tax=Fusarium oxysporum f. sp. conglutinans race 2 54008 TaxID=1089457 RepID=X0H6B7_FUSOX|nr:hypothetical protein FOPG_16390 [Fusarium oxysporum f. sp. conglutinans race 2 54008]KAI8402622.1 hypothetical protein FOFC_17938 [Fusarium oxysporum]
MTTVSLTVSRNVVIALCIVIPLIFIVLIIIVISLCLNKHPRRSQSHESDEFPLRSSHSTTSAPPGYCPCFALVGTEGSIKLFLEDRGYEYPTGSYDRAFGHFRIVCNPSLNDMGVDAVVMLHDASLSDMLGWAYSEKKVVFMGPDPVKPPWLPKNCTLGLVDPFPPLVQQISRSFWV